jgi:hypothetical protein
MIPFLALDDDLAKFSFDVDFDDVPSAVNEMLF